MNILQAVWDARDRYFGPGSGGLPWELLSVLSDLHDADLPAGLSTALRELAQSGCISNAAAIEQRMLAASVPGEAAQAWAGWTRRGAWARCGKQRRTWGWVKVRSDPAPDVPSLISRVRSPYAPAWGGLQRPLV